MRTLVSDDGTRIAFETVGSGPPLILVDGAFCHRGFGPMRALAKRLSPRFRVLLYDRRGRGESEDTPPYGVAREVEDLVALARELDGEPFVYGTSSGAVLAARAVAGGLPASKLALYEPPLALDGTHVPDPPDFRERIASLLEEGRRKEAVELFLRVVGVPRIGLLFMRLLPGVFRGLKHGAPTLPNDFAVLGDTQRGGPLPEELARALRSVESCTLVMAGGKSPAWMKHAAERVADAIPRGRSHIVPGQTHNASAKSIALELERFFANDLDRSDAHGAAGVRGRTVEPRDETNSKERNP